MNCPMTSTHRAASQNHFTASRSEMLAHKQTCVCMSKRAALNTDNRCHILSRFVLSSLLSLHSTHTRQFCLNTNAPTVSLFSYLGECWNRGDLACGLLMPSFPEPRAAPINRLATLSGRSRSTLLRLLLLLLLMLLLSLLVTFPVLLLTSVLLLLLLLWQ